MRALSQVRENWDEGEAENLRLLRKKGIAESVGEYLVLRQEFERQLHETEPVFGKARDEAMIQLQTRLAQSHQKKPPQMENLISAILTFQELFEKANLPSAVIGGLAVSVWGEPRLTRDVDVKVLAWRDERARVLQILSRYTPLNADPDAAFQCNGLAFFQTPDGVRIDVMLTDTLFDETVIGRAKMIEIQPGQRIRVCSAEDLIIYKMVSVRAKDRLDVETIVQRQGDKLDDRYVENWLTQFEQALDDSTLMAEYRRLREKSFPR
jgi:hypothetical protein